MKMEDEALVVSLWVAGVVSLGGLWVLESQASLRPLTVEEQRSIVGGETPCTDESYVIADAECPSGDIYRSLECTRVCNNCYQASETQCNSNALKAWYCKKVAEADAIIECIYHADVSCEVFGGMGLCGTKLEATCKWDPVMTFCEPGSYYDTETPCPRRDCK
ncbi:hypothetical protein D6833_02550 [Candidatus Parcubacteria bacterium]|nr:MAG: hypothetical protein D6833_02550 [Candidatus Parcubacteria bacterium]